MKKIKYFTASWCAPCKLLRPVMEELQSEGYNIDIIDIDDNQQSAIEHGVMAVPTCILYNDSAEIDRWSGFKQKSEILNHWNNA
mgnify:CR=1 FL=1